MNAKLKFKEGWIMLLRPFLFAELKQPLQKMTILYAYSEKPLLEFELNSKGKESMDELLTKYTFGRDPGRYFNEDDLKYQDRMQKSIDAILSTYSTVEVYKGEMVQCYVENIMCRFYPDEYNVIRRETFEEVMTSEAYTMDIEGSSYYDIKSVQDKVHYVKSRGIDDTLAKRMCSAEANDSVIFRPKRELLEIFCRENEIY
jgi:hypothetical protein